MNATRELGEVRITVCRSMLESDRGEMDSARFLPSLPAPRGVENREPGMAAESGEHSSQHGSQEAEETPKDTSLVLWSLEQYLECAS